MVTAHHVKAPGHLWAVGIAGLLWNAFGCIDYTMTKLDPVGYMTSAGMGGEAIAYMQDLPSWLTVFWALGVWGSLAGSILLLLRSRRAVSAFGLSLLGLAVSQAYQYTLLMPAEMRTPGMWMMTGLIWAALLFFLWYALRMRAAGVLR